MTGLRLSPDLVLPENAVTESLGILGQRGAGKSNTAVVLAEEMWRAKLPWVAVDPKGDWYGVRAPGTGKGLPVPVLGGLHGDAPVRDTQGDVVADMIVDEGVTAVLDVSDFSKAERTRFLIAFFDRLYQRHRRDPHRRHLFLEEAHEYIPQNVMRDDARLKDSAARLVLQGRSFGIGTSTCSQRSARLHKDVLTQVGTLVVHRTTGPQDRAAIGLWVKEWEGSAELLGDLPHLRDGQAWVWSPHFLGSSVKVQVRRRHTFDSGATPTGGIKDRQARELAPVDIPQLLKRLGDAAEKQAASDPAKLKARIRDLERQIAQLQRSAPKPAEPVQVEVRVPVFGPDDLKQFAGFQQGIVRAVASLEQAARQAVKDVEAAWRDFAAKASEAKARDKLARPVRVLRDVEPVAVSIDTPAPRASRAADANGRGDWMEVKAGARSILEKLARHHPMRFTRPQVGTLTGFKVSGGTFQSYWSSLKTRGWVAEQDGFAWATDAGLAACGVEPAAPATTDEMLAMWKARLKAGARQMLDVLVAAYPNGLGRDELAGAVGMTASGGTFQSYLSSLKTNGLARIEGGQVHASDTLFIGAAR